MIKHQDNFYNHLRALASAKRESFAYAGSMSDGGAAELEREILIYQAGVDGTLPDTWKREYKIFANTMDPEYEQYLKLKEKFE